MNVGIVGGGVFGIAAAVELRRRMHVVTLFDQGNVPYENSSSRDVSRSIRRTFYGDNETYVELVERSAVKWRQWETQFESQIYHQTGSMKVVTEYDPGTPLYDSVAYLNKRGAKIEVLSSKDASERFPQFVFNEDETCMYEPWNGYIESGRAIYYLAQLARREGVSIFENRRVVEVEDRPNGATVVFERGAMRFDVVVVAPGVWMERLLPDIGKNIEVTHQQMVFIEVEDTSLFEYPTMPIWSFNPHGEMWYGFPLLREGYLKISNDQVGPRVDPDIDRQVQPEFVDWTLEFLRERVPELAKGKVVGGRSCLFANTPDDHFIIDWLPNSDHVLVAGGGSSHAFKFGGSIGEVIADRLEDKYNPLGDLFKIGDRFEKGRRARRKSETPGFALSVRAAREGEPETTTVRARRRTPAGDRPITDQEAEDAARQLHRDSVVIDGLNVSNWDSPAVYRNLKVGGVTAINATNATWEGYQETLDTIAAWPQRYRDYGDVIAPARTVDEILQAKEEGKTGVILGFQNASPIENDLGRLEVFHRLGVRIIQLTYHERNLLGNGCYERRDGGLSYFGVDAVKEMNRLGILIDLSHVGVRTTMDAIELSEKPVACTHANAKSYFDVPRNKADDALKLLAEKGGVVGATCITTFLRTRFKSTVDDYVEAIDHMVQLVGIDHVAIGTDYAQDQPEQFWIYIGSQQGTKFPSTFNDGSTRPWERLIYPTDLETTDKLPNLAVALMDRGYESDDVVKVIGGNWLRLFQEVWA